MSTNIPRAEDLDWVRLRQDMDEMPAEPTLDKAFRKFKENPAIPIGCVATIGALTYGIYNFLAGRSLMSQYMMRTRIVAQGFTVVAIVASLNVGMKKST